ncbi:hypothetical protein EMPS_11147 [Entomortierella parvispora]|uniref:Uncharacterized protein n=1 Tax=Entomortierella parvispora TaxID=205924 RepID=A0A9P3M1Y5_9FUNG|nr:hypothetical protein EMPS_11147 [Entomortierella parvispora]
MDLNWCPVCEQHIPLAWESSLYCSDRCKKADAIAHPSLGYAYPDDLQTFPRNQQRKSISLSSPLSSPTLTGMGSSTGLSSSGSAYPSPPTSPMSNYVYNKTSHQNKISPPSFSLGHSAVAVTGNFNYDLEMRRKSQPYSLTTTGTNNNNKKGFFW